MTHQQLDSAITHLRRHRAALVEELERVDRALTELGAHPSDADVRKATGAKLMLLDYFDNCRAESDVTVEDAVEALHQRGWITWSKDPRNVVASTLGQMARDGLILKMSPGLYRPVPENERR